MPDPALIDLRIIQGSHWSLPMRLVQDDGTVLDTTGYTARMNIRADQESSTILLDCTTTNGRLQIGFNPPKRANSTAYAVGQQIVPTTLNGFIYECTVAGTSNSSAPTYPTTINTTVTDGTVTWKCKDTDARVSNVRIALTPSDTSALANWGNGVWDLELIDTFSNVTRIAEGLCVLSREITR